MFVDRVEIEVQAGAGGNGCCSFRRERYVPLGGPDGGDGGDGGSIVIQARPGVDNLAAVAHKKRWVAGSGGHGSGANRHGRNGPDVTLEVPPGTVVLDAAGGFALKDLAADGDRVTVARGGKGGKGNTHFKTATHRAPREWTRGGEGESRALILELKTIADVGLVGLPNAGKSTLLSRVSHARPQIADYPFTTRHPHLGRFLIDRDRSFILADIPGLIEGAHAGAGLGHEFLRHVERTRLLVHLVEPLPLDGSDPVANYHTIRKEISQYSQQLGERRELVAVTKAELPGAVEVHERMEREIGRSVNLVSAVTGTGLNHLLRQIVQTLDESRDQEPAMDSPPRTSAPT